MKEKHLLRHEEGQSLIIVGALMLVLVALIGMVVDSGNAYAQRRIVQNGADAAALAGSQMLVHQEDYLTGGDFLENWQVIQATEEFAERNGIDPDDITIFYTDIDGNVLADAKFDLGRNDIITPDTFGGTRAEGLRVEAELPFETYFVRVVGRTNMTAHGSAQGILACGACTAGGGEGLFPIAFYQANFDHNGGLPLKGHQYRIFEKDEHFPGTGSFGWLSWNQDGGHTSNTTLVANMGDTTRSGQWSVGDSIPTGTGVMNSSSARLELQYRIDNRTDMSPPRYREVTLPVFDYTEGNGSNLTYHIYGFARFRIDCYHFSKTKTYGTCDFDNKDNSKWIAGTFVDWTQPTGESGCTNFGVCSAKLRPPLEVKRTLVGNVVPWRVFVAQDELCGTEAKPVDLVHVMDISGSMCARWDGRSHKSPPCSNGERIQTAKDIITEFNEGLDWHEDNRVGLVTYPTISSGSRYYTDCYYALGNKCKSSNDCRQRTSYRYFADKNVDLTTDFAYTNQVIDNLQANGGTSMPLGLQYGREVIEESTSDNLKVIILTTDGMANIKLDGKASGYIGNTSQPYWIVQSGCNDSVYQGAVQQANQAKNDGIIIFTIGIHENIDEDLMTAIASPSSDPTKPHFFKATSGVAFEQIYEQIQDRLPVLCSEECLVNENAAVGNNAVVRLYDDGGSLVATTTADASGGFVFTDLEPGTYELRAVWVDNSVSPSITYDVPTWALGGAPMDSGEKIEIEIPMGTGATHKDVYLRTSQQLSCD